MSAVAENKEDISAKQLVELCRQAREQADVVAKIEMELEPEQKKLSQLQAKIQAHMEELELEKFPVTGYGTFFLKQDFSVKVPKGEENRQAFFSYLKERGIFDDLITVNSQTLNAWYKEELSSVAEKNGDLDFKIPGIDEPSEYKKLQFRKETKRG